MGSYFVVNFVRFCDSLSLITNERKLFFFFFDKHEWEEVVLRKWQSLMIWISSYMGDNIVGGPLDTIFFSFSSLDCPSYNHTSWNCRTVLVNIKFSYFIIDWSIIDIARWRFVEWVTFTWSIVTVSRKKYKPSSNRTCKLSPTCFRTLLANLHLYVYIWWPC